MGTKASLPVAEVDTCETALYIVEVKLAVLRLEVLKLEAMLELDAMLELEAMFEVEAALEEDAVLENGNQQVSLHF